MNNLFLTTTRYLQCLRHHYIFIQYWGMRNQCKQNGGKPYKANLSLFWTFHDSLPLCKNNQRIKFYWLNAYGIVYVAERETRTKTVLFLKIRAYPIGGDWGDTSSTWKTGLSSTCPSPLFCKKYWFYNFHTVFGYFAKNVPPQVDP